MVFHLYGLFRGHFVLVFMHVFIFFWNINNNHRTIDDLSIIVMVFHLSIFHNRRFFFCKYYGNFVFDKLDLVNVDFYLLESSSFFRSIVRLSINGLLFCFSIFNGNTFFFRKFKLIVFDTSSFHFIWQCNSFSFVVFESLVGYYWSHWDNWFMINWTNWFKNWINWFEGWCFFYFSDRENCRFQFPEAPHCLRINWFGGWWLFDLFSFMRHALHNWLLVTHFDCL